MSHPFQPGRFPSINQGPSGMPEAPAPDPPGYYMGWPLAGLGKRVVAGFLDYVVFFFLAMVVGALVAEAVRQLAGADAGAVASFFLLFAAYGAFLYNFSVLQSRTGQTWGNRIVGVRSVTMVELRPPGKVMLGLKPFFEALEIVTGVAFVAIAASYHRQTLSDRFCGIVVIDERRAGMTLPWVLPGAPAMRVGPPVPQGGVPRPERRPRRKAPPAPPPAWTEVTEAPPPPEPDELPEPEVEHHSDQRRVRPWQEAQADPPTRAEAQAPRATYLDDPPAAEAAKESPPTARAPARRLRLPHSARRPTTARPSCCRPPGWAGVSTPSHDSDDEEWPELADAEYFRDPAIVEAIRAGDLKSANERAGQALEVYWEQHLSVDIAEAVVEYRTLIRRAGKAIRADDATVAGWLRLV